MSQVSSCVALTLHTATNGARLGDCPPSTPRATGEAMTRLCNNGSNVCDDSGNCVGSYCLGFDLQECQCMVNERYDEDRLCDVCCQYQDECQSTLTLAVSDVQCISLPGIHGTKESVLI